MTKRVAVLAVNPVNGAGLFQYLEAFYENGIPFKTFAVAESTLRVMKSFADRGTPIAGHCAAALLFDQLGIAKGRRVALHPYIKSVVRECIGTDEKAVVDGNFYTAQTENAIPALIPALLKALK